MTDDAKFDVDTHGIFLSVVRFDECVDFYHQKLGFPIWFSKENLVCLRFGSGYLLIKQDDRTVSEPPAQNNNPMILRFNVKEVRPTADQLIEKGIEIDFEEHLWGQIATFHDPDGNACQLKNSGDPYYS
ncbi:hypothetical protein AB833_18385 [Chromatiales bacterium (ex Bugula neritina AB1)]|nr:hypothetical protein AB833_18385 [Chromatiales bacterium (ex Bugula neritina AB1)]